MSLFKRTSERSPPDGELAALAAGRAIAEAKKQPDAEDKLEHEAQEIEYLKAKVAFLNSTTSLREGYARQVYDYLVWYSISAGSLLLLSGAHLLNLPDNVLITIAGSTAVSAIGLVAQIGRGLFASHDDRSA